MKKLQQRGFTGVVRSDECREAGAYSERLRHSPLSDVPCRYPRRITQMLKKRSFQFYPFSITLVAEKSCLGRQGINLDVALQLATAVVGTSVSGRRRGSGRQGGCQRTFHASGGRRAAA